MASSATLYITQIRFCRALAVIRSLPTSTNGAFQPSIADRLNFYGLYKQAVAGDCQLLRPSSRLIVQYAKWKSWDKLRGTSPIEAQAMYIHALIELLTEFLVKYPDSYLTESIKESLAYLQETEQDDSIPQDSLEDAFSENDKERYYLGQIEEQLLSDSYISSPVTSEFPLTPELSPRPLTSNTQNSKNNNQFIIHSNNNNNNNTSIYSNTTKTSPISHQYQYQHYPQQQQQQQQQQHQHHYYKQKRQRKHSSSSYSSSSLLLYKNKAIGEGDEYDDLDKEVATATSSLSISSPNEHPYQVELAVLQHEINTLYNEISLLNNKSIFKKFLNFKWMWLFKSIAKHVLFNFVVMMLLFFVLWRRKSPIAYAVLSHAGPRLRDLMRYLFQKVVYWKVTV